MKLNSVIIATLCFVMGACVSNTNKELDNILYCQNTMWSFDNKPETSIQKARLMQKIGFDGLEGFGYKDFFEQKKELNKVGLHMPVNYVELPIRKDGSLEVDDIKEIEEMIKASQRETIVYFHIKEKYIGENKSSGDRLIVSVLRQLSDFAEPFGVKLSVYPHINYYCETLAHSVKLAQMVNRVNYGATMNLCHLLKVEGADGLEAKVKLSASWLFAVNISGADDGDTMKFGWDKLIQPLGQGSFDVYSVVKLLKNNGYEGPFGIQCYNLKGDVVEVLSETLVTWNSYKDRYAKGL